MYCQWLLVYSPVGYPGITRWAGVDPGTRWVPGLCTGVPDKLPDRVSE